MYGNDSFKTEYGKHLGRYWISLYVKGNGLRIPEYRGEGDKRKAPYSTKYRMVYVNGDVPLQGKGYGRIGEVDVEKKQLQIKELKTKEELKDQFAAYNRLLLDFKKMDNFDDAYHWFESVTENYSHIDIKEGLMRNVRNIAGTLDEIVIGMEGVGAEEFCCLLSYMDIIENNPFSWKEYQGDIQRWVNRNSDFRQKLQDGLEKFVKLQENQEVEEDILKSIYALGYYKYIVSEEDFIKKIIH